RKGVLLWAALENKPCVHYGRSPRHLEETSDVWDLLFSPCLCCVGIVDHVQRPGHAVLVSRFAACSTGPDAGRQGVRHRTYLAPAAPSLCQNAAQPPDQQYVRVFMSTRPTL